jgi:hypothetical protein
VQRDEVMPPTAARPYWSWMRRNSLAVWADRLLPRHLAPRIGDLLADHRVEDALLVGRIAPGEAALDAGVAAIGLAVLPRNHANEFVAAHLGLEGAADAAIGAGRDDRMLGLADLDDGLFRQRRGRAGLHAGAAGNAFRIEEGLVHAGRDAAFEAATFDRQREGALHLFAGAHAARADDALRRIVGEVRVGLVLRHPAEIVRAVLLLEDVVLALISVAHVAQADAPAMSCSSQSPLAAQVRQSSGWSEM